MLFVVIFNSCNFLEEEPKGLIGDSYAKTEEGIESLVLSLYACNRDFVNQLALFADNGTDVSTYAVNGSGLYYGEAMSYNNSLLISNENNSLYWKYLYNCLNVANTGIKYVEEATIASPEKREKLTSEVHALRAFYLFMIVETWGPASHYSVTPSQSVITKGYQPGIAQFYKTILDDLDIADENLQMPDKKEFGRINQGVAKAIRMRVLMSLAAYDDTILSEIGYTKSQCYEETIDLCTSLINDYGYELLTDYASIFDVKNQINNEIIWSIQYTTDLNYNGLTGANGNNLHKYWVGWYNKSVKNPSENIDGLWGHSIYYGRENRWIMPTYYYIRCFSKYDKRRAQTFQTVWCRIPDNWNNPPIDTDTLLIRPLDPVSPDYVQAYKEKGIIVDEISDIYDMKTGIPTVNGRSCYHTFIKFLDPSRDAAKREESFKDVILIRLGEVYITLAEAYVRTGQKEKAASTITELRKRAIIPGHENELKITADEMNMNFILEEGARELGGELNRWYMLKRSGMLVEWVKEKNPDITLIEAHHIYRPLPQDALYEVSNLDEFIQNKGYN